MARFESGLLSAPCPVYFAGWRSTTTELQQNGWQLSAEQDYNRGRVGLVMKFEPAGIYLLADSQDFDYFRMDNRTPQFIVRRGGSDFMCHVHDVDFSAFDAIDCRPQFIERKGINDFNLFATVMARTEEIIVEPATVAGLLDQIRKLQAPELAAIRERNRNRDRRGEQMAAVDRQTFHAQILTIAR